MPFFGKPQVQLEAMQIFNAKNGTGRKKVPEDMQMFEKSPIAARGYADFQFGKGDMKETGAGGYAIFRKTPNIAGGYADFQLKK